MTTYNDCDSLEVQRAGLVGSYSPNLTPNDCHLLWSLTSDLIGENLTPRKAKESQLFANGDKGFSVRGKMALL